MASTLETSLKHLLVELEGKRDEYKDMKHQDGDKECEAIYRGKSEAYWFAAEQLKGLMIWHGIIKQD